MLLVLGPASQVRPGPLRVSLSLGFISSPPLHLSSSREGDDPASFFELANPSLILWFSRESSRLQFCIISLCVCACVCVCTHEHVCMYVCFGGGEDKVNQNALLCVPGYCSKYTHLLPCPFAYRTQSRAAKSHWGTCGNCGAVLLLPPGYGLLYY